MSSLQTVTDKASIGLSLLCALHCLALPIGLAVLPSLASLPLQGESFHLWMLVAVIPTSVYALTMGCKMHQRYRLFATGMLGISCLVAALIAGGAYGELWEKVLTVIGATIIAVAHCRNYRLCQHDKTHNCNE